MKCLLFALCKFGFSGHSEEFVRAHFVVKEDRFHHVLQERVDSSSQQKGTTDKVELPTEPLSLAQVIGLAEKSRASKKS